MTINASYRRFARALWPLAAGLLFQAAPANADGIFDAGKIGTMYYSHFSSEPRIEYSAESHYQGSDRIGASTYAFVRSGARLNLGPLDIAYYNYGEPYYRHHFVQGNFPARFRQMGANIHSWIRLERISPTGRELDLDFIYKGPGLSLVSGEDHFTARVSVQLKECDRQEILTKPSLVAPIEDLIRGYETIDFIDSLYCDFAVTRVATGALHKSIFFGLDHFEDNAAEMTLRLDPAANRLLVVSATPQDSKPDGSRFTVTGPNRFAVYYNAFAEPERPIDPEKAAAGIEAARELTNILKDYGDLLILVSANPGEAEDPVRRAAMTGSYFDDDLTTRLRAAKKTMNEGLRHMTMSQVLSLHLSINRAYEYVKAIELRVTGRRSLDRVIRSEQ